jgi:probable HAF family extracellular repeat protein
MMNGTRFAMLAVVIFSGACADPTQPIGTPSTASEARKVGGGIGIIDLGTLGGNTSYAWGLNSPPDGQRLLIVGESKNPAGQTRASYWSYDRVSGVKSAATALTTEGDTQSGAWDANEAEQIAGWSYTPVTPGTVSPVIERAVLWTPTAVGILLGNLGGSRAQPSHINSAGQVIGTATTANGDSHPFLWDPNPSPAGTFSDLGFFSGSDIQPVGRNQDGTIVGSVRATPADLQTAFVWTSSGGLVLLPDLGPPPTGDGVQSYATAINNAGVIVGFVNTAGTHMSAVRWTPTGAGGAYVVQDLGLGTGSRALDINNSDEIVGDYRTRRGSTGFFLSGTTLRELPILSNSAVAFRINDRGDVIGFSYFRNAHSHAVLWTNVRP